MLKLFHFLARFTSTIWLGIAFMLVLLTVIEILSGQFDSIIIDTLIVTRFPVYYAISIVLLFISVISGTGCSVLGKRKQFKLFTVLVAVGFLVLLGDYYWVYHPLEAMLTPIGSPRPQEFQFYHKLTESLNGIAFLVILVASILINLPLSEKQEIKNKG